MNYKAKNMNFKIYDDLNYIKIYIYVHKHQKEKENETNHFVIKV